MHPAHHAPFDQLDGAQDPDSPEQVKLAGGEQRRIGGAHAADATPRTPPPTLRRIERVDGRSDDVVWLPGAGGRRVAVHPMQFAVVARDRDVVEFQVVQEGSGVVVFVVARADADGVEDRVRAGLADRFVALGLCHATIEVRRTEALERSAGGKLRIVSADRTAPVQDTRRRLARQI